MKSYVDNDMFDPDVDMAAAVRGQEKVSVETAFRRSKTFSRTMNGKYNEVERKNIINYNKLLL